MSRREFYDHPARKSVVREGRVPPMSRGAAVSDRGGDSRKSDSLIAMVLKYKTYIIVGGSALIVLIAYQLYSRRVSKKKDDEQVQRGLKAISGAGAVRLGADGRPLLQVDPGVIEVLQQQVVNYQAKVSELENAVNQRDLHYQQQMMQQQQQQMAQQQQASAGFGAFAGLHGQVPPPTAGPGPGGQSGPMQLPSMMQPVATREPGFSHPQQQMGGGQQMQPQMQGGQQLQGAQFQGPLNSQQPIGMSAFASDAPISFASDGVSPASGRF